MSCEQLDPHFSRGGKKVVWTPSSARHTSNRICQDRFYQASGSEWAKAREPCRLPRWTVCVRHTHTRPFRSSQLTNDSLILKHSVSKANVIILTYTLQMSKKLTQRMMPGWPPARRLGSSRLCKRNGWLRVSMETIYPSTMCREGADVFMLVMGIISWTPCLPLPHPSDQFVSSSSSSRFSREGKRISIRSERATSETKWQKRETASFQDELSSLTRVTHQDLLWSHLEILWLSFFGRPKVNVKKLAYIFGLFVKAVDRSSQDPESRVVSLVVLVGQGNKPNWRLLLLPIEKSMETTRSIYSYHNISWRSQCHVGDEKTALTPCLPSRLTSKWILWD